MARDDLDRGDQRDRHAGLSIPKEFQKLSVRRPDKDWILQTSRLGAWLCYHTTLNLKFQVIVMCIMLYAPLRKKKCCQLQL